MKISFPPFLVYFLLISFIIGWWVVAFRISFPLVDEFELKPSTLTLNPPVLFPYLSPLSRNTLHQALAGDFPLILELISNWDQDAQILSEKGVIGIQRLSSDLYLQAHLLAQLIQYSSPQKLCELNHHLRANNQKDDAKHRVKLKDSFIRFLPQTFVAASFLLAIASPQEIVALPKGLREFPQLYPSHILKGIPSHEDHQRAEKLYLAQPHLAFTASYTHPSMLEMLKQQGIECYPIKDIDTLKDIQETLLKVGQASHHLIEANLLKIFIEASFLAIDNRFRALEVLTHPSQPIKNILCLSYQQHYLMPTIKCLTGQLLQRMLIHHKGLSCPIALNQHQWHVPFEQEKIHILNPDCLILSLSPHAKKFDKWMEKHKMFQELTAFRSQRVFYMDETVQESPNQYIVLAYFDLFQVLAAAHHP